MIACFPVYRTYVRAEADALSPADEKHVAQAVEEAGRRRPELPPDLFDLLADVLLLRIRGANEFEFVMRFQQLTGPVMAKGVEDTAFYRYNRLLALNEVGGDPGRFGASSAEFHAAALEMQAAWPTTMLASSTHDSKRSDDVRVRIGLLSEMPDEWAREVWAWRELNEARHSAPTPDRNTEYLVYQTLVGVWPIGLDRLWPFLEKAVREAKVVTNWTDPNEEYEAALRTFVEACLADPSFIRRLDAFVARLAPAWQITSLAQTLLRLTSPGVPDIYQGSELWDLSLVDPDNRRPVDYKLRRQMLERARAADAEQALAGMAEGLPKLWLIQKALAMRARRPELFGPAGAYMPLTARGARADHVVAFARGGEAVIVVPRLVAKLAGEWRDTQIDLPAGAWHDELSGEQLTGGAVPLERLLSRFPVALLLPAAL